ncbi:PA domain-containing protein [Marinicella rhabdoformis]|uniref:PA domain-containing protein n=1 Tax=Marinicella rhabdoformis TaxID=2580566 RepID=UPI0012AEB238|nr:PA domain-containing protein [Marinicella rhabdoformis]
MNQSIKALLALGAFVGTSWYIADQSTPTSVKKTANIYKETKESKRYDQPGKAAAWLAARMKTDKGTNPALENIRIKQQLTQQLKSKKASADMLPLAFEEIGPGIFGGRIRAFAIHPEQEGVLLAGGVSGGMWKSTDDGKSWQAKTDFLPNIMIGSMTTDPDNPNRVFVGTGEGFFNFDSAQGAGIYVSEDFGETWSVLSDTLNDNFYYVNRLARVPDSDVLLAATNKGIFRSENLGQTWSEASGHTAAGRGFVDLKTNPTDGNHILAVHYGNPNDSLKLTINSPANIAGNFNAVPASFGPEFSSAGINNQVILTDDNSGFTDDGCQSISNNISGKIALIQRGTCDFTEKVKNAQIAGALAVLVFQNNLDDPFSMGGEDDTITIPSAMITKEVGDNIKVSNTTVNASIKPELSDPLGRFVMESTNGGNSWQISDNNGLPAFNLGRMELNFGSDGVIYVAASNADDATLGLWRSPGKGQLFTKTNSNTNFIERQGWYDLAIGVNPSNSSHVIMGAVDQYVTHDGGNTIGINTYWSPNLGQSPQYVHADHHGYFFSPHNAEHIYVVSDGGVSKSENGGETYTSLNNGLNISQSYGIAVSPSGDKVTSGTQDNGSQMYYGNSSDWFEWQGGDGGYSAWDQQEGRYVYGSYVEGQMYGSDNQGMSAQAMVLPDTDGASFIQPFVLDDNNGNRMMVGTDNVFYTSNARSLQNATWTDVSDNLDGSSVSALAFNPNNSSQAFVGTSRGNIYRIDGLGSSNTVTQITPAVVAGVSFKKSQITDIKVSPSNRVYATLGDYRHHRVMSSDGTNNTWESESANLPDMPLYQIAFDPTDASRMFLGSELGLWVSTNNGWEKYDYGVAFTRVIDLVWHGEDTLFVGTHGRGTFKAHRSPVNMSLNKFVANNSSCDDDAFLDGGESGTVLVEISNNSNIDLTGVLASWNNPVGLTFSSSNMNLGTLSANSSSMLPIQLNMDSSNSCLSDVDLDLTVAYQGGSQTQTITLVTGANQALPSNSFKDNAEGNARMTAALDLGNSNWLHVRNESFEGEKSWFTTNEGNYSDKSLTSPWLTLTTGGNELSFALRYDMEGDASQLWDGAVLEFRTENGRWHDIGNMSSVPYDGLLYTNTSIQARSAWSGTQLSWREGAVDLGETYAGQKVQFRFRVVSDGNTSHAGFWVDDIQLSNAYTPGTVSCDTCISDDSNPRPNKGMWFDPSRNGHGFVIENIDYKNTYYTLFYTFENDGTNEWYNSVSVLSNGVLNENYEAGTLDRPLWDANTSTFRPDPTLTDGRLSINFNADQAAAHPACQDGFAGRVLSQSALATWKINNTEATWCIQPIVAEQSKPANDFGGTWWGGLDESGWGFSIAQANDLVTGIIYYYDAAGNPRWSIGSAVGFEPGQELSIPMAEITGFGRMAAPVDFAAEINGQLDLTLKHTSRDWKIDGQADLVLDFLGTGGGSWDRSELPIAIYTAPH